MSVVRLAATAIVVLRGFVSERSLVASLALVVVSLGIGVALADASLGHEGRFEADIAWASAEALGWFLALTQGAGLAGYRGVLGSFALARPVPENLLLAGRFLGLAAGLFLYAAAVSAILLAWLSGWLGTAPAPVLGMGWLLWLRLLVVLAVATFLLALARPFGCGARDGRVLRRGLVLREYLAGSEPPRAETVVGVRDLRSSRTFRPLMLRSEACRMRLPGYLCCLLDLRSTRRSTRPRWLQQRSPFSRGARAGCRREFPEHRMCLRPKVAFHRRTAGRIG